MIVGAILAGIAGQASLLSQILSAHYPANTVKIGQTITVRFPPRFRAQMGNVGHEVPQVNRILVDFAHDGGLRLIRNGDIVTFPELDPFGFGYRIVPGGYKLLLTHESPCGHYRAANVQETGECELIPLSSAELVAAQLARAPLVRIGFTDSNEAI